MKFILKYFPTKFSLRTLLVLMAIPGVLITGFRACHVERRREWRQTVKRFEVIKRDLDILSLETREGAKIVMRNHVQRQRPYRWEIPSWWIELIDEPPPEPMREVVQWDSWRTSWRTRWDPN